MSEQLLLTIIEASLRAMLLAAAVAALLALLRVPRGAARHGAWLVVVVGMLMMPLLQRLETTGVTQPRRKRAARARVASRTLHAYSS
jgi:hypothetical protein